MPLTSIRFIPQFIHFYGINMDDVRDPVTSFKTFNEFFCRKFKPHSRPIADPRNHVSSDAFHRAHSFEVSLCRYPRAVDIVFQLRAAAWFSSD